jgi:hypothetical protein
MAVDIMLTCKSRGESAKDGCYKQDNCVYVGKSLHDLRPENEFMLMMTVIEGETITHTLIQLVHRWIAVLNHEDLMDKRKVLKWLNDHNAGYVRTAMTTHITKVMLMGASGRNALQK